MNTDTCVGFADCPCRKCRATRLAAAERHHAGHIKGDRSYCGACRTEEQQRYRVPGR